MRIPLRDTRAIILALLIRRGPMTTRELHAALPTWQAYSVSAAARRLWHAGEVDRIGAGQLVRYVPPAYCPLCGHPTIDKQEPTP